MQGTNEPRLAALILTVSVPFLDAFLATCDSEEPGRVAALYFQLCRKTLAHICILVLATAAVAKESPNATPAQASPGTVIATTASASKPDQSYALYLLVICLPVLALNFVARKFEYEADRAAAKLAGIEVAIQALVQLYEVTQVPADCNRVVELFISHPSLANRIRALRQSGVSSLAATSG